MLKDLEVKSYQCVLEEQRKTNFTQYEFYNELSEIRSEIKSFVEMQRQHYREEKKTNGRENRIKLSHRRQSL